MVSYCIQNLKNKKNGNLRKEAEPHRCYIVPSMLNVPSLYYVLYLCTEVYEYKLSRWEVEIHLDVFFWNRGEAHIHCAIDA